MQAAGVASDEVRRAVAGVRSDGEPCCWSLLGYSDERDPKLVLVASGDGAAEEMAPHLTQAAFLYALVRAKQTIDAKAAVTVSHPGCNRVHLGCNPTCPC